jgi:hypothetical protein
MAKITKFIWAPPPGPDDPIFSESVRISSVIVSKGPSETPTGPNPAQAEPEAETSDGGEESSGKAD